MIISHIIGGLGNQMFQYAAARCVAEKHHVPLKLDISDFSDYNLRTFALSNLNTSFSIASPVEISTLKPAGSFEKAWQYLKPKHKRTYHRERHFEFDKSFFHIGPDTYLKGNFQSARYFEPIAALIRKEFTIDEKLTAHLKEYAMGLSHEPSVSIHIRRGDYQNKAVQDYHGILTTTYYQHALTKLRQEKGPVKCYFFSDDIEWVKQNIIVDDATYVSGTITGNQFEDLYLMSHCQHNIIANSSFSWWAAWLNANPDKSVIAPQKWFNQAKLDTRDLIPDTWVRL